MIISPSSRPKHGRARVDSFSKIVTRMLEKYDDVDNKMMMTLIMIIIYQLVVLIFTQDDLLSHTFHYLLLGLRDLGTLYEYNNVTVGLDIAGALRSWNSPFPGYSAPGRLL